MHGGSRLVVAALAGAAVAVVAVGPQLVGRSDRPVYAVADADLVAAADSYLAQADPSTETTPEATADRDAADKPVPGDPEAKGDPQAKRDRKGNGKAKGHGKRDANGRRLGKKDDVDGADRRGGPGNGRGLGLGRVKGLAGGRVTHGEFVVRTKSGFATAFVQQGDVTAATATSVTVKSADGYTKTYAISGDTMVTPKGASGAAPAAVGSRARVVGTRDGDTFTVRRLHVRPAKSAADTD
jgi:hypothetical protein